MKEMKAHSKNRDPFSRIPIPKSFYHPSQQKTLTKTQKKIALSPSKESRVSPEDEAFLKGSNFYSSQTPPTRENDFGPSKFDESWPSSERPSIASTSGYDRSGNTTMISEVKQPYFTHLDSVEEKTKTGSVLQRYVNRFRNSEPMSREERVQKGVGHNKDFWWLGKTSDPTLTPASSSTPKDEEGKRTRQFIDRSESQAYRDTFQSLSSARKRRSQLEDDIEIQKLQEKADRILGQSESSMGSLEAGPAVSSDGIASSESQSSSFGEPTITPRPQYRTEFKDRKDRDISARTKGQNEDILSYKHTIKRPEDDILYQWRLQRKMDLSRHGAAEMMAKNNSEVQTKLKEIQQRVLIKDMSEVGSRPQLSTPRFTLAPSRNDNIYTHVEIPSYSSLQEPEKISKQPSQTPYIASPTLSRQQQRDKEHVEPHLHLMCDVLPCPHAQKYQEQFQNLYGSESLPNGGGADNKGVSKTQQSDHTDRKVVSNSSRLNGKSDKNRDMKENKRFVESENSQTSPRNRCDSARVKSNGPHTQAKSSTESLNRVTSPEVEADLKQTPCVVKSTEIVLDSVDFESSEMDLTDREKETLQDEEIVNSKDPGSSKRIPKSPTKSKVIHPKYSSSPARSSPPISSAIGQTVKDYMFTASSSVDSMTSLLSNIADSPPDRQQNPSSSRPQRQLSSGERSEQTTSSRVQSHSSSRQGRRASGEIAEQTQSSSRQQREASETSRMHQTSSSRQQRESTRRAKSPSSRQYTDQRESTRRAQSSSSSQQHGQSSRQYLGERESSRRAHSPPSSQHHGQSSRQYSGETESSRRAQSPPSSQQHGQPSRQYSDQPRSQEKERDSTESMARSSKDLSIWSSRDSEHSYDGEDQDHETRYSAEIADDNDVADDNVSDEEFLDDQLLKLLRQQRNDLEKKLDEIDKQLLER